LLEGADEQLVAAGDDGRRRLRPVEQAAGGVASVLAAETPGLHLEGRREVTRGVGLLQPEAALAGEAQRLTEHEADAAMAELEEVVDGVAHARAVVGEHRAGPDGR